MMKFRNPRVVPPGGKYFYEVPETRAYIDSCTRIGLETAVRKHYSTNGIMVPVSLKASIEDFMCHRLPKGFCSGGEPTVRVVSLREIRWATEAVLRKAGGVVSRGEAKRRAGICGGCDRNDRTMCPTCVGLVAWGLQVVKQPALGFEAWLGVCAIDCAALSAKVYGKSIPAAGGYPEACWVPKIEGEEKSA